MRDRIKTTIKNSISDYAFSFLFCSLSALFFLIHFDQLYHWFIIPVAACGVLIGVDAVKWCRGKLDVIDPVAILGLIGLHFFFIAPQLHVALQSWLEHADQPSDWRPWLGAMALLNFLSLCIYRIALRFVGSREFHVFDAKSIWIFNKIRFALMLIPMLFITGILQLFVYLQFGGIGEFILRFEQGQTGMLGGMGWIFMISESFPILCIIGLCVYSEKKEFIKKWPFIFILLSAFFVIKMIFGGLRGSRSNTLWGVFWAVGIIHTWIRPIPRRFIVLGLSIMVLFMYVYGFYKSVGTKALEAFEGAEARTKLTRITGRSLEGTILGDLGRSDIQAFLLYRINKVGDSWEYGFGSTYLGAISLLIPKWLWPDRPPTKVKEGTIIQYGEWIYTYGNFRSSRIYGLAGEVMLNFGIFAVPVAFGFFGCFVAKIQKWYSSLPQLDSRRMIVPLVINLLIVILVSDSDNSVFFLVKNGFIPFCLIYFGSDKVSNCSIKNNREC